MVFRYCLGMIMSVSTLMIGRGAATPVKVVNFSMSFGTSLLSASSREAGFRSRPNRTEAYGSSSNVSRDPSSGQTRGPLSACAERGMALGSSPRAERKRRRAPIDPLPLSGGGWVGVSLTPPGFRADQHQAGY